MPATHHSLEDPAVFQAAYRTHHAAVVRAAYAVVQDRVLAEDVAQDVFLSLWRRPGRYDASRGDLGAYLRLMGRSRALDAWRSGRSGQRAQERLVEHERCAGPGVDETTQHVERRERASALHAAVGRLPDTQREALALAYWGGLPASEVADRTCVPLGTAKSRLRLGLARLRTDLAAGALQPTGA